MQKRRFLIFISKTICRIKTFEVKKDAHRREEQPHIFYLEFSYISTFD